MGQFVTFASDFRVPVWAKSVASAGHRALQQGGSFRAVLVLPTLEAAATYATVAALRGQLLHVKEHRVEPVVSGDDAGRCVSAICDGRYIDARLHWSAVGATVRNTTIPAASRYFDAVRLLPVALDELRAHRRIKPEVREAWDGVLDDADGLRTHARVAARPIVCIGNRSRFAETVGTWLRFPNLAHVLDSGDDVGDWFRHPTFVVDPAAQMKEWVRGLPASLVVIDGAAAWRSPLRHAFRQSPQLLLLDRRATATTNLFEQDLSDVAFRDWRPPVSEGVEAAAFDEIVVEHDEDEDLY